MAKQQAKSGDNVTRWIVIAMVLLVVATGVGFSLMSQNNKENASLAALDGFKANAAFASSIDVENGSAPTDVSLTVKLTNPNESVRPGIRAPSTSPELFGTFTDPIENVAVLPPYPLFA